MLETDRSGSPPTSLHAALPVLSLMAAVLGFPCAVSAQEKLCESLIPESELLWMKNDFDASDQALAQAKALCSERAEVYWRLARNDYDRLESIPRDRKPPKEILLNRYASMEQLSDTCVANAPNDGNCYLWKAIAMGRQGTTLGILHPDSIRDASKLEETFLKAVKLAPQYRATDGSANSLGDAYTALGQYYRVAPEWTCYIPLLDICGDLDKALEYQRKAVAREPKRIEYAKELGAALLCHGLERDKPEEVAEGKRVLEALQSFPESKPYESTDKAHARQLVASPSLACGYSRDGQQNQDRDTAKGD